MNNEKIISIHQPNFFPWFGFFDKIAQSDCFVYLDHTRMNPDQTWIKRTKILNQGKATWLIIPHIKQQNSDFPVVKNIQINLDITFQKKHLRTIEFNYNKAPFFHEIYPLIEEYYTCEEPFLVRRNIQFIEKICKNLDIKTPRIFSSDLACKRASNELLIEIIQQLSGTSYLSGGGSSGYQVDSKFEAANLQVFYQKSQNPTYNQYGSPNFIEGLSIIDHLANCGFGKSKEFFKRRDLLLKT